ncbi:MAG: hypothetical protein Fur0027_14510 [Raineya sp.]
MAKQSKTYKSTPNDELHAIWDRLPDLKEVYQVGTCYFTELHYAENYAKIINKTLQIHKRDGKTTGE